MRISSVVFGHLLVALALGCAPAAAKPAVSKPAAAAKKKRVKKAKDPKKALADGHAALTASKYAEAEALFRSAMVGKVRGAASIGLSETLLMTGRYGEAVKEANGAAKYDKAAKGDAAYFEAEALRRQGKLDEAIAVLRNVEKLPDARRARLLLGEVLIENGSRSEAETPLMTLIEDYNSDKIADTDGVALSYVGRAAHLLRSPQDANDAFNESERAKKGDIPTLLWRAELFLEKYDPGHAEEVTREVLAQAPNHPEALVWMAHVKLAQALDFDAAESLSRKALKVNPKLGHAYFVLAGIALRDMELAKADQHADDGLKHNPRDLDLLSMKAAIRFLADDSKGFKRAKKKVLKLNSGFSRMYQIVGEYAEWEHRYEEIVKMMREAVLIDSEDAKARAQLGLNLIRSGDDAGGLRALQKAFKQDSFNVRVFNTLNLYEDVIPKHYVTVKGKRFTFRYHKKEKEILERYVPQMMNQAWKKMVKTYGFEPKQPVGVELYAERQNFAIRTSGLPSTAIQGVCFGQTLASMSPRNETFNVGMTLWHELAHVFHIQLSKNHVPRWFTEGMAEYETIVARPEWQREHDPDLYEALRSKRLPQVGAMNKAFTRAEELKDIATAYYASSQILVMLGKSHGDAALAKMLRLWGDGKRTKQVVQEALGMSTEQLDDAFQKFAKKKLARYDNYFTPIERTGSIESAKKAAEAAPKDAQKQTVYALALLRNGKTKAGVALIDKALKLEPKLPDARWIKARLTSSKGGPKVGQAAFKALLQDGIDGYSVRMVLANIAEKLGDLAEMKLQLQAAHKIDPTMSEPIQALVDLARKRKDKSAQLDGLRKLALLDQHDPRVYRRLMQLLLDEKKVAEAKKAGEAAIFVDMEGLKTHQVFAEVLAKAKMVPRAIYELETALLCKGRPKAKADVHAQLAATYLMVPNRGAARKHAKLARKLDKSNKRLKKLKI